MLVDKQDPAEWFRDSQSLEHGVYVQAYNRFQAFGLAMHQMCRCSWANADYRGVQQMTLELLDESSLSRRLVVTRDAFETWLLLKTGSDRDVKLRKHPPHSFGPRGGMDAAALSFN